MYDRTNLSEAARYNDAGVEELGLPDYLRSKNIDADGIVHVANQRALRMALAMDQIKVTAGVSEADLSPTTRSLLPILAAVAMDGIAIGLTARS